MKVTQITPGRFHHFHLARQMEKYDLLDKIYTGYPLFKLKDEKGIPIDKINSYPWFVTPYMRRNWIGLGKSDWLKREWEWKIKESLDKYVEKKLIAPTVLIFLSGNGCHAAKKNKRLGGINICDRGSAHILFQNEILKEEYDLWGVKYKDIDKRVIEKEIREYELADKITIPSEFSLKSFINKGISANKLIKIPYGARLGRFKKIANPDKDKFVVLWVGNISFQKGFLYALEAFKKVIHPDKTFKVVGSIQEDIKPFFKKELLENVTFLGNIPNQDLVYLYNTSNVFVLASIQEGLAMVQGEALACGCPVIATTNTGADDLFEDGIEGFIVPIRSTEKITEKLQILADNFELREKMSIAALKKVKEIGGWDTYGESFYKLIDKQSKYT